MGKGDNKPGIDVHNEAERINVEIDRLITNPKDRETLKEFFKSNYLLTQFFFRSETDRDIDIEDRVIGIVMKKMQQIYLADNDALCKNVAEVVRKELTEYLAPWDTRLESIEKTLEGVSKWQEGVDGLIERMDGRIETLEKKDKADEKLLKKFEKFIGWKNMLIRKAIVIIIAVAIALILFFEILNSKLNNLDKLEKMMEDHVKNEITR